MKTLKFKSNINCGSCVEKVAHVLNQENKIHSWSVDTSNPAKLLTINTTELSSNDIELIVNKVGYKVIKIE